MPDITILIGVVSKLKLLLWLQKHYIHPEFKPNDAFPKYILYVYFMGHKRDKT